MKYIKKHWLRILGIEILFAGLAYFAFCILIHEGSIQSAGDNLFHWQRYLEISNDLLHFHIPQFNNATNVPYGIVTPTMYPWLSFVPFVPLKLITNNGPAIIYSEVVTWTFIGLSIAYWSLRSLKKDIGISALFAVIYVISSIPFECIYNNGDFGAFTSSFIMPLVFVGWIKWMHNKDSWTTMTVGMCLMMGCHVMNTLIAIISLGILSLLFYKQLHSHLRSFIKATLTFTCISSVFWIPTAILMCSNTVSQPISMYLGVHDIKLIPNPIMYLIPFRLAVWSYSDLVSIIFIAIYWKRLSTTLRKYVYVSLGYIFLNFNWLPWKLLQKTPLSKLQYMYRINFISHLLLTYVFIEIVRHFVFKNWYIQNAISFIVVLLIFLLGCSLVSQYECIMFKASIGYSISRKRPIPTSGPRQASPQSLAKKHWSPTSTKFFSPKLDTHVLGMPSIVHFGFCYDYAPKHMMVNYGEKAILAKDHQHLHTDPRNGYIQIRTNRSHSNVIVPYALYHQQTYHVYDNGRRIPVHSYRNRLLIKHLSKGTHDIKVKEPIMWYRWVSAILAIIGVLIIVMRYSKAYHKHKRMSSNA